MPRIEYGDLYAARVWLPGVLGAGEVAIGASGDSVDGPRVGLGILMLAWAAVEFRKRLQLKANGTGNA
jgi:hypothetical protein